MYQEFIAEYTASHLREHIGELLEEIDSWYEGTDKITLVQPKSIDAASAVGGIVSELPETLPAYSVDCANKTFAGVLEDLYVYEYVGQINGMVSSGSRTSVEKLINRHAAAVEAFIRRHQNLHFYTTDHFRLIGMAFVGTDFSGAERVQEGDRELWLAAFSIDVLWDVSEDGPSNA